LTEATGVTRRVVLPPDLNHLALLGRHDDHLRALEAQHDVRITARGHDITLRGEERGVAETERVLRELVAMLRERPSLTAADIRSALRIAGNEPGADVKSVLSDAIPVPSRRRFVTPKTANQRRYLEAVRAHDLVIAAGIPGLIGADAVKPGATVIDVGIHRGENGLRGDVRFDEVAEVAGLITPVPGGVGPMTIAMLLANTLTAATVQQGLGD